MKIKEKQKVFYYQPIPRVKDGEKRGKIYISVEQANFLLSKHSFLTVEPSIWPQDEPEPLELCLVAMDHGYVNYEVGNFIEQELNKI